jgi:hypothetical protein
MCDMIDKTSNWNETILLEEGFDARLRYHKDQLL